MNEIATDLSELLCARLCHDLAGPLGAVASGVELLGEQPEPDIVELVAVSAATAVARLRLLRAALGPAGPARPVAEIKALVQAYLAAAAPVRFELDWPGAEVEIAGPQARLALALVMVARDALPRGGMIRVTLAAAGGGLSVGFQGGGAELNAETRAVLAGMAGPAGPRTAPAAWAARLAGGVVRVEMAEEGGLLVT